MNGIDKLRQEVCEQNRRLLELGLVLFTEGNVSARFEGLMAIKPSGVPYDELTTDAIAVLDIRTGKAVVGNLKPSVDAPIHLEIYRCCNFVGGIVHTHSPYATAFAQAGVPIPCLGTTHADEFLGDVPVADFPTQFQANDYDTSTGRVIVNRLAPSGVKAVLLRGHGPFVVGGDASEAVKLAAILERVAGLAYLTLQIKNNPEPLPKYLAAFHFERKHGSKASYGQNI